MTPVASVHLGDFAQDVSYDAISARSSSRLAPSRPATRSPGRASRLATRDDVADLPPTVVSVKELDPLRDEGVACYRLLLVAGVAARGRIALGTTHAIEQFPTVCPELSRAARPTWPTSPGAKPVRHRPGHAGPPTPPSLRTPRQRAPWAKSGV